MIFVMCLVYNFHLCYEVSDVAFIVKWVYLVDFLVVFQLDRSKAKRHNETVYKTFWPQNVKAPSSHHPPSMYKILKLYVEMLKTTQAKSRKYRGIFEEHSPVK